MKSEAGCYSIDDLKNDGTAAWQGVRNYQARNFMMNDTHVGDLVLFYHSSSKPTGVYGLATVAAKSHVDETQFNTKDDHYDKKATKEKPIWYCVDIAYVQKFKEPITLDQIKFDPKLDGMMVRSRGSRLSIQPVSKMHYTHIVEMAGML